MKTLALTLIAIVVTVQISLTALDSMLQDAQAAQVERVHNIDKQ